MKETHRGITTTTRKLHEKEPLTITNRLGQLSLSLPRIDDKKRWSGYPGLAGTARKIAQLIPKCETYIEVFAGSAKVFQEYYKMNQSTKEFILNDTSKFIYKWLKQNFKLTNVTISKRDFKFWLGPNMDTSKTFYLIDYPWYKTYYDQTFSSFTLKTVREYNKKVIQCCQELKHAKFIITTRKENNNMLDSEFNNYLVESEYVVSGKYPKVLLTTNLNLDRRKGLTKLEKAK